MSKRVLLSRPLRKRCALSGCWRLTAARNGPTIARMFNAIGAFLGRLWRVADFWRVSPIGQARVGSPLAGLLLFLVLLFGAIGFVLVALGFDLNEVDRWLDAQGGWMDHMGRVLFRGLVWLVFAVCAVSCVAMLFAFFFDRASLQGAGCGLVFGWLFMAFVAWLCSASLFAPLY